MQKSLLPSDLASGGRFFAFLFTNGYISCFCQEMPVIILHFRCVSLLCLLAVASYIERRYTVAVVMFAVQFYICKNSFIHSFHEQSD